MTGKTYHLFIKRRFCLEETFFLLHLKIHVVCDILRSIPSIGSVTEVDSSTCSGMYKRLAPVLTPPYTTTAANTLGI